MSPRHQPLTLTAAPNQLWSLDFVMDTLSNGRRLKCLNIVDDCTKEAVDIVVDHSITGEHVDQRRKSDRLIIRTLPTKGWH